MCVGVLAMGGPCGLRLFFLRSRLPNAVVILSKRATLSLSKGRERAPKGPEDVSPAMQIQGVFTKQVSLQRAVIALILLDGQIAIRQNQRRAVTGFAQLDPDTIVVASKFFPVILKHLGREDKIVQGPVSGLGEQHQDV